ncbi:Ig-like domain-containing protein [Sphingosinicella sp. CPCC 101087]|uniref:Ig-like domain-containing protein n=1 Tax=Sphingosinicella sp. CPCC 101087 TaxID=2497754 RepID=UPI00101D3141|nr:Ig-like domain-containing protein [Sphingosinicella sp. CPCC 101087]
MTATYHSLASGNFQQDWSDTGLIGGNDDWNGVPGILGYLGDYTASSPTNVDPRTLTAAATLGAVDVIANQSNPNSLTNGGVAEFQISDPTIALNGSGTADAPSIVLHLDATGRSDIRLQANIRDLDGSPDNSVQQFNVQFRTDPDGEWINVPGGYFADVTAAGATMVTMLDLVLPQAANNAATLQVRLMTTNASGNDEWVGIDDLVVSSGALDPGAPGILSIADASVSEGDAGTSALTFTVTRDGGSAGEVSAAWTIDFSGNADTGDLAAGAPLTGTVSFADGQTSATITVMLAGDTQVEPNETFAVTLSSPTGGATLGDSAAVGTILNDDSAPAGGGAFINEVHYDNTGTDAGEAVEIAGPAGTSLAGWTLVLYNGNGGAAYGTIALSGIFADQDDGFGTLSFDVPGLQNGSPDGLALVDAGGNVVQFLSYEGSFTATNGPAAGLASTDIGVAEEPVPGLGQSLQLVGFGANYEDFSWVAARDDSFGAVNEGQDFIAAGGTGLVSIGDVSVAEGDSGVQQMVFTVRRAGGLDQPASVDWVMSLTGGADTSDLASGQPLSGHVDFAAGVSSVQIVVEVAGDTIGEPNERFEILLANPAGNIDIVDGAATGTILNDDPVSLAIWEIQGEGHRSNYEGQPVTTGGIVTAVSSNGFYLQDAVGDGNDRTSDAMFVFTGAAPGLVAGDAVQVSGTVAEFLPGGDTTNLTVTQLTARNIVVQSTGNALPAAALIGAGGRLPPTQVIDDDGFATYDPDSDGIDFYESLEGMLTTIDAPLVVSQTNSFGETYVVASGGEGATGVNGRGGITVSDGDYNPEKIQIDATSALFDGYDPAHSQGDRLSDVTGVMSYGFNSYELLVTQAVGVTEDVTLGRETTALEGDADHLTVASYNVENLDPGDSAAKFNLLAGDIVYNLLAPDVIGLQEMQDGNGMGGSDPLSAIVTAQLLIDAIAAIGGPDYVYVEVAPSSPNSTGGEPGGNIRNGYLYNADRVEYVDGSAQLIEAPAFNGTRRPLVADFTFNGETVSLINVHFTSRIGSDPLWGSAQPPADAGDAARTAQAQAIRAHVDEALASDPSLKLGVLGDFNAFWFEDSIGALEAGGVMTDLHRLLPEAERYSYLFDGNLQALDHMLVTGGLAAGAEFDSVHINAEQADGVPRGTDHDPLVGRFFIPGANEAPVAANDAIAVDEDATSDNLWEQLLSNDFDPDAGDQLEIAAVDSADTLGTLIFDAETQSLRYVADADAFDALAPGETRIDSFSYTITDPDGLTSTATVQVTVTGINDGLALSGGNGDDVLEGTAGEDRLSGGNGEDWLLGLDGHDWLDGGNHDDVLIGGAGNDVLNGGNHDDILHAGAGADVLNGGNHADRLNGGAGDDVLTGGNHNDVFIFSETGGNDLITDFRRGQDKIDLSSLDAVEGGERDAFAWVGASAFSGTAGELRSYSQNGANWLAGDVDGDAIADFTIQTHVPIAQTDVIFG